MKRAATLVLAACAMAACSDPNGDAVRAGVHRVGGLFRDANRNPIAAASLLEALDQGAPLTRYLAASLPENAGLPPITDGKPGNAWTIGVRTIAPATIVVDGSGHGPEIISAAELVHVRVQRPPSP